MYSKPCTIFQDVMPNTLPDTSTLDGYAASIFTPTLSLPQHTQTHKPYTLLPLSAKSEFTKVLQKKLSLYGESWKYLKGF
jgi:hypothetical protein